MVESQYFHKVGVPVTSLRFLFDGRRINDDETPKALEMEQVGIEITFILWSILISALVSDSSCLRMMSSRCTRSKPEAFKTQRLRN